MYDAIVVGARCAGSPTAMLLARKGYKVLLVDKSSFPSDTISTHLVWPTGASRLERWGLLDSLVATGCPSISSSMTFDVGPLVLSGSIPGYDGVDGAYCPRRSVLDQILVEAAVKAGAELREKFSVQEVTSENGTVTGVRGSTAGGTLVDERARIVVGADGRNSRVAKAVSAPSYNEQLPLTCYYYSYWSGIPQDGTELYDAGDKAVGMAPTNDGLSILVAIWQASEFHRVRADIEGNYMKAVTIPSALADRVRSGRREEGFSGTADVPNYFRKPYGPGWALVGDAGYHKDPFTAQGISDAFRDAETLAEAIDAGLSGRTPMEDALANYELVRNQESMPMYEFTCDLARMEPPPAEMQQLFSALAGDENESSQFFGALTGTVPLTEFFAPGNLERIIAAAGQKP
jgi:flavin-dependent dehydrogenase